MNISYIVLRIICMPLSLLPFRAIHFIGTVMGTIGYYILKNQRKKTLSNIALATTLQVKDIYVVAKHSFQNLAITLLEFPKFAFTRKFYKRVICTNPHKASEIIKSGTGVIFFCAHQANWELLFLEGTQRMPGVAVGRPIKNEKLYSWIVKIREKFGGKIIPPKKTIKEGIRALRAGKFFGIVGDQALPESNYSYNFFGRRAWTTTAPAILSYRTGCPIIVATIERKKTKYIIKYSDPLYPDKKQSMDDEINRLTVASLKMLESSIQENPGQWLWQHNRWKQDTPATVYYRYNWDTILVIIPKAFKATDLSVFREIYPNAFITVLTPESIKVDPNLFDIMKYKKPSDVLINDLRFKLVFNLTNIQSVHRHFLNLSALKVLSIEDLKKGVAKQHLQPNDTFGMLLKKALARPNTIW